MIVVCSNNRKNELLKELNDKPFLNIKFMTKKEFIHSFYFSYNQRTIYEVMNKYNCNYAIAKIYLDNLYYIEDKNYNNEKLDNLVSLKKYLQDNNYLIYDNLFKDYIKSEKIIFDNCDLNNFDQQLITKLKQITKVEIKTKKYQDYDDVILLEFSTIDDEVEYVAIEICKLIDSGVDVNKIKLVNINNDYNNVINRIFKMYNLKICEKINLYATEPVQYFIKHFNSDIRKTINSLRESKMDELIIDKIIDVCNQYNFVDDYNLVKDLIINNLKEINIVNHYKNEIEVIDLYDNLITDEYVFLLNYNLESIPKIYFDDAYITDDIKYLVNLETVDILNKYERNRTVKAIKNIKNLVITYKLRTPFAVFSKANLLDIESKKMLDINYLNYSTLSNKIKLAKMLDNLIKYKNKDNLLDLYYKHFKIDYNSFDNKYKGIKKDDLKFYLNNQLNLSYTSMNEYYKCAFKYYLKYILKIDKKSDEFKRHIGSIFHYVLEKGLKQNIDINQTVIEYIKSNNISLNSKEEFFLKNLCLELPFLIDIIRKQDNYILLKNRLYEESISVNFNDELDVTFKGVIDKIIYQDNMYALIDYKTGSASIDLSLNYYGINMQLAIYLYLAKTKFPDASFAGFYLQNILSSSLKDDIITKEKNLKLNGYSNSEYIKYFDKTYQNSSLVKSLKLKNDGNFSSNSKVLNNTQINNLIKISDEKIKECIKDIANANFTINPKNINSKNISCEFCNYKDICFFKTDDIVYLKEPDSKFLGGE